MTSSNQGSVKPGPKRDNSLGMGVYYSNDDYVGVLRRIGILLIDGPILFVLMIVAGMVVLLIDQNAQGVTFVTMLTAAWLYDTVLKPSRFRTVGYRLMGCKIVGLNGKKPSTPRLTFRSLLWLLGPLNLLYDLAWCGIDEQKQTLRDRFAGTTVIRNGAQPIGTGPIHLARFSAMGFAFVYPQVVRQPSVKPQAAESSPESASVKQ